MNDAASASDAVALRRPPPSTYLWTADGRIRELRRPLEDARAAPAPGRDAPASG